MGANICNEERSRHELELSEVGFQVVCSSLPSDDIDRDSGFGSQQCKGANGEVHYTKNSKGPLIPKIIEECTRQWRENDPTNTTTSPQDAPCQTPLLVEPVV